MRAFIAGLAVFSSRHVVSTLLHATVLAGLLSTASGQTSNVTVAAPFISPMPGTYTTKRNLVITDATAGSLIYYTTDGSTPTPSSKLYTGPIFIDAVPMSETVQAIAVKNGVKSAVKISTFSMVPPSPAPTYSRWQGTYWSPLDIAIVSPAGITGRVHYTLDGSTPTLSSPVYSTPIHIAQKTTISAFREASDGYTQSPVSVSPYSIVPTTAYIAPAAGTYTSATTVKILCATPNSVVHYTTDGSTPTPDSPVYTGPFTVPNKAATVMIRAIATLAGVPGLPTANAYVIVPKQVIPTPVITPGTGTYGSVPPVTIADAQAGTTIYYTIDGSTPNFSSPKYSGAFKLPPSAGNQYVVQAFAFMPGGLTIQSDVVQSTIKVGLPDGVIASVDVKDTGNGQKIPTSFLGFSHELTSAESFLGQASTGANLPYRKFVDTLTSTMGGPLVVRFGGNSTDRSGAISTSSLTPLAQFANAADVKFILGVNLAGSDIYTAKEQAQTYASAVPVSSILSIEVGNEPDSYVTKGIRPASYTWTDYLPQYQKWASMLSTAASSSLPVAGPTLAGGGWINSASAALSSGEIHAALVTQHRYVGCYNSSAPFASDILLDPNSSAAQMVGQLPAYVAASHQQNIPFRIAEINSICAGGQWGVSNSFSSALWAVDAMFELANIGVDGVNWNTDVSNGPYDLFHLNGPYKGQYMVKGVNPLFYGLVYFARAAGKNAEILASNTTTTANLKVWVTKDTSGNQHVLIINKEKLRSGNVTFTIPGFSKGKVDRLLAPSYQASTGLTMAGQTYDGTTDGSLVGSASTETIYPNGSSYTVSIDALSAVTVNLEP